MHSQLFEMVYYKSGFTWTELYDMPIWLRTFYYKKVVEARQKEKKSRDEALKNKTGKPKISKPMVRPK